MKNSKSGFLHYAKRVGIWAAKIAFWLVVAVMIALTIVVVRYGSDLPDYRGLATYAPPVATRLYASDGSLLIEYAEERRVFIDYADLPPQLVNAFVAAEDQNFWHHPGIDVFGVARASMNNVIHFMGFGSRFTGASTITQQVAKNFFLTNERTVSRKIREALLALKLERTFSKQHIITLYLNQIFLGARAYGVGSASLMYFNKPVNELTLSESAFLASLPKAPNDLKKADERRNYVLRRMREEGYITREQEAVAAAEPLKISKAFLEQQSDDFQYFAEEVRQDLLEKLGRDTLYNGGLYIKTTIVPEYQRAATAALKKELDAYNRGHPRAAQKLQGAVIALNPHTGRILAMSGGYSFADSPFNRATQALRQVGSTIKPFVYLAALEQSDRFNPTTLLLDAPIVGWKEGNTQWKPENYDRKFLGDVTLRVSLETSRNVPTVRLVEDLTVKTAIAAAQKFGVYDSDMQATNLSLALGSGETTLERLAFGYAAFINGGYRHEPKLVDYVQDRYGKTVDVGAQPQNAEPANNIIAWADGMNPTRREEIKEPLSDPQSLYQVVSILQGVVDRGTGKQARVPGRTIAGKTGTTNDVKDVWFVGFSKNLVVGVYLGFDTPAPLGDGAGSFMAARVFGEFMTTALANEKDEPFAVPNGMTFRRVNRTSGESATDDPNGTIITEVFKPGQSPNPAGKGAKNGDVTDSPIEVGGVF